MNLLVKICGLSTEETVDAALDAGADMLGFVFHPKSPRYVSIERAAELAGRARGRARIVALTVDADDGLLTRIVTGLRPDWLQLHGSESVDRVHDLHCRGEPGAGRPVGASGPAMPPVMKALGIAEAGDVEAASAYFGRAPLLLLDAKAPAHAAYPGGHGRAFDWTLLKPLAGVPCRFMLGGGLNAANVGAAIDNVRDYGVPLAGVDVSSGVESAPGVKDVAKIRDFVAAARDADASHPQKRVNQTR